MPSQLLRVAEYVSIGSATVPLLGASNIWVEDALQDDSSIRLTQFVIQSALQGTSAGQLEVTVFDDGLSGLAAPFWPLNSGGEKLLTIINDEPEFRTTLRYLRDHVQAVKNVMQGKAPNLVAYRTQADSPVEGYKLIVLSTDLSMLDDATQLDLSILLKAGPAAGVSFLIHSMTLGANPFMVAACDHMTLKHGMIEREDEPPISGWKPPLPQELIDTSKALAVSLASGMLESPAFMSIQPIQQTWEAQSDNGVTFAIGKYGSDVVEITLGDELNQRHNMLVTGAVGQGKSNLISVIIHSLCERYSPEEIQLYLLDFKEGVTLQQFFNTETGEYLPHARVLGLEADREFGLSVLQNLFDTYKERMRVFKAAGVQNIREYRKKSPDTLMPRIIVIIDEFQMMFAERDKVSDEIADLLVRGVRLFRACGIHVILASQTIGGNMSLMGSTGEGLFGQVPIRVALKNSLVESHATLGDRNDAAAHLRAREGILNEDYGELSSNRKTAIAFADEKVLGPMRNGWWRASRATTTPPYVFSGEKKRSLVDDHATLMERPRHGVGASMAFLGSQIDVDAHVLAVPFSRDIGRNIVLLGQGEAVIEIESIALSLATQRPDTQFAVLDCLDANASWDTTRQAVAGMMTQLGSSVQMIAKDDANGFIVDQANSLATRQTSSDLVIVGLGMDRLRGIPMEFQDLVKMGPAVGIHFIGWWLKMDTFREQVGYGGESLFDIKLALRVDPQTAKQLVSDPLLEWRSDDNRMLAWDATELAQATRVIPYSVLDPDTVTKLRA